MMSVRPRSRVEVGGYLGLGAAHAGVDIWGLTPVRRFYFAMQVLLRHRTSQNGTSFRSSSDDLLLERKGDGFGTMPLSLCCSHENWS